jgi:hypothetical protein
MLHHLPLKWQDKPLKILDQCTKIRLFFLSLQVLVPIGALNLAISENAVFFDTNIYTDLGLKSYGKTSTKY